MRYLVLFSAIAFFLTCIDLRSPSADEAVSNHYIVDRDEAIRQIRLAQQADQLHNGPQALSSSQQAERLAKAALSSPDEMIANSPTLCQVLIQRAIYLNRYSSSADGIALIQEAAKIAERHNAFEFISPESLQLASTDNEDAIASQFLRAFASEVEFVQLFSTFKSVKDLNRIALQALDFNAAVLLLYQRGHNTAARQLAEAVIRFAEARHLSKERKFASLLVNLGLVVARGQGNAKAGLPIMQRAHDILQALGDPHDEMLPGTISNMGMMLFDINRKDEGLRAMQDAINLLKNMNSDTASYYISQTYSDYGTMLEEEGQVDAARAAFRAALNAARSRFGPCGILTRSRSVSLGQFLVHAGFYAEALDGAEASFKDRCPPLSDRELDSYYNDRGQGQNPLLQLAETYAQIGRGKDGLAVLDQLGHELDPMQTSNLHDIREMRELRARILWNLGGSWDAIDSLNAAISMYEQNQDDQNSFTKIAYDYIELGQMYSVVGDQELAQGVLWSTVEKLQRAGLKNRQLADALVERAEVFGKAFPQPKVQSFLLADLVQAIAIYEMSQNVDAKHGLARAYQVRSDFDLRAKHLKDAAADAQKSFEISSQISGEATAGGASAARQVGRIAERSQDWKEAESWLRRAYDIDVKTMLPNSAVLANDILTIARVVYETGRTEEALKLIRQANEIYDRRWSDAEEAPSDFMMEKYFGRDAVSILLDSVSRVEKNAGIIFPEDMNVLFRIAQREDRTQASIALADSMARAAGGSGDIGTLVRHIDQTADTILEIDRQLPLEQSEGHSAAIKTLSGRHYQLSLDIEQSRAKLARDFPRYAQLATPKPLDLKEVQSILGPDDALVYILSITDGVAGWIVTKSDVHWVSNISPNDSAQDNVTAIKCGLDYDLWRSYAQTCARLTGTRYTEKDRDAGRPLPFDPTKAFRMYKAIFGDAEQIIKGKRLIVVADGPLSVLPLQVLVSADPGAASSYRDVRWLIQDHAVVVLPGVSSLESLHSDKPIATGTRPLIGFGNPLLDGAPNAPGLSPDARRRLSDRVQQTRANASCPAPMVEVSISNRGIAAPTRQSNWAGVSAELRRQAPLPETATELCGVASVLGAGSPDVFLAGRATVSNLDAKSASGDLATYRLLYFATHGAMAGQGNGLDEPGLVLTPPDNPTESDDGYLSASHIAKLKLNADWVILSACNTAASGANDVEAMSGLARAFFYAGARSVLVSHWSVDSIATVKLVSDAVAKWKEGTGMGKAEALRSAMVSMIIDGPEQYSHPSYWGPFVLVGGYE